MRSSSPARACISVDLPEPDGPMMAVKLAGVELDVDAVEGPDGALALAVGLGGADGSGGDRPAGVVVGRSRRGAAVRVAVMAVLLRMSGWCALTIRLRAPDLVGSRGGSCRTAATYISGMTGGPSHGRCAAEAGSVRSTGDLGRASDRAAAIAQPARGRQRRWPSCCSSIGRRHGVQPGPRRRHARAHGAHARHDPGRHRPGRDPAARAAPRPR